MQIIKKIFKALIIILVGNFNFFFLIWILDKLVIKGVEALFIFLPFVFTIAGTYFLFYDYFYAKVKKEENKIIRSILSLILILSILFFAIVLQIAIYYIIFQAL